MDKSRLTTQRDWDDIWDDIDLPLVYQKGPRPSCIKAILEVFDKWLTSVSGLSVLEIGGFV